MRAAEQGRTLSELVRAELIDLLLRRPAASKTVAALVDQRAIHAPHLVDTEVLHVLRR